MSLTKNLSSPQETRARDVRHSRAGQNHSRLDRSIACFASRKEMKYSEMAFLIFNRTIFKVST